ncbi:hypothetical protein [Pseudomonas aeruginosa]|uniref:hypothetical protein n=1 Tax=Pseudomonas aeruginosa TaxID=287 RepID=UPI001FB580C5|nr:hypothetical protein [Pseudomonas aeruginosa]
MSKELNKAPVEQAGGDERAAFESRAEDAGSDISRDDFGNYVNVYVQTEWEGWQARAALAQPSPVRSSLLINGYQLRAALDFIAPDGTAEQLKSEACIEWRQQDADFLEAGLYAFCAEYPEEGGVLLDEEPTTAQPSPLQSEQAEAERPEVVARVVHSNPVVLGQCGPLNANDELMTVAQHAASVARWAEMFNRVEQERDVALARVDALAVQVLKLGGTISFAHHRTDQAGQVPQAWLDVQAERRRQVEAEGWTPEHDDAHSHGEMARAAACYALAGSSAPNDGTAALLVSLAWPWDEQWWKPTTTRRDLVKACALGLAEIERLDRAGISQNPQPGATTASS